MICWCDEMDKLKIPQDCEIESYDLNLINDISRIHPYQYAIFVVYKYYSSYYDEEEELGDVLHEIDYFMLLDRYYKYGITFDKYQLYPGNIIYIKEDLDKGKPFKYIVKNYYSFRQLVFNEVKIIRLSDLDRGEITHSEIEKWKRKVVNQQTDRKTKLRLLNPNVYHSLITFVVFSKFEGRPHNKIDYELSWDGISETNKKINNYKDKYNYTKMYEDKIYNKIKNYLKNKTI